MTTEEMILKNLSSKIIGIILEKRLREQAIESNIRCSYLRRWWARCRVTWLNNLLQEMTFLEPLNLHWRKQLLSWHKLTVWRWFMGLFDSVCRAVRKDIRTQLKADALAQIEATQKALKQYGSRRHTGAHGSIVTEQILTHDAWLTNLGWHQAKNSLQALEAILLKAPDTTSVSAVLKQEKEYRLIAFSLMQYLIQQTWACLDQGRSVEDFLTTGSGQEALYRLCWLKQYRSKMGHAANQSTVWKILEKALQSLSALGEPICTLLTTISKQTQHQTMADILWSLQQRRRCKIHEQAFLNAQTTYGEEYQQLQPAPSELSIRKISAMSSSTENTSTSPLLAKLTAYFKVQETAFNQAFPRHDLLTAACHTTGQEAQSSWERAFATAEAIWLEGQERAAAQRSGEGGDLDAALQKERESARSSEVAAVVSLIPASNVSATSKTNLFARLGNVVNAAGAKLRQLFSRKKNTAVYLSAVVPTIEGLPERETIGEIAEKWGLRLDEHGKINKHAAHNRYLRLTLQVHPDRPNASDRHKRDTEPFYILTREYAILCGTRPETTQAIPTYEEVETAILDTRERIEKTDKIIRESREVRRETREIIARSDALLKVVRTNRVRRTAESIWGEQDCAYSFDRWPGHSASDLFLRNTFTPQSSRAASCPPRLALFKPAKGAEQALPPGAHTASYEMGG